VPQGDGTAAKLRTAADWPNPSILVALAVLLRDLAWTLHGIKSTGTAEFDG